MLVLSIGARSGSEKIVEEFVKNDRQLHADSALADFDELKKKFEREVLEKR
jgi:hypothetical protein